MSDAFPQAYFGSVDATPADWRAAPDDADPDDEQLRDTPADVIDLLGFDPASADDRAADLALDEDSKPVKRYEFDGIRVGIETPKGQVRDGRTGVWAVKMPCDYGYIFRSTGVDGDRMDVFVGPYRPEQLPVFVVNQHRIDATKAFDEHKVLIGFQTIQDATACYDAGFPDGSGPARRRAVWQMTWGDLRDWLSAVSRDLSGA